MVKTEKNAEKIRFTVKQSDCLVAEVSSPSGRRIGHVISGRNDGPRLLVAGTGARVRSAYQRLLFLPSLRAIQGKLLLLYLDELDVKETHSALKSVAKCVSPISGTLFLDNHAEVAGTSRSARGDDLVRTVLGFLESHGVDVSQSGQRTPLVRDCASQA